MNGFEVLRFDHDHDDIDLDVRPSRDRFDRAAQTGRRRRRRKLVSLAAGSAVVIFSVGAASLPRGAEPNEVLFTNDDVTSTVTSPDTMATVPIATVPIETAPQQSTTLVPTTLPSRAFPTTESVNDLFVIVSGDREAVIDVRNAAEVVATFDLTCPSDRDCQVESARVMGDTIWVAISEVVPGAADTIVRSRVVSASLSAGEIVEHLAMAGPVVVRSAGRGADGMIYARVNGNYGDRALVTIESGEASVVETGVSGFQLSDDGRFLAVSFSNPPLGEQARSEITDLVENSTVGFDSPPSGDGVNAGPAAWSPDGRFLIMNEQWEDSRAWVIDPWSGSGEPIAGTRDMLDGACFMSSSVVAHRTWNVGYGQGDANLGTIRLMSLDTGSTVGEIGSDIFADAFHCHADGSISYLRRPVIEVESSPGFVQPQPDYEASVELIHIAADGTVTIRAAGDLRMV